MKLIYIFFTIIFPFTCLAEQPEPIDIAWKYISAKNASNRRVIIESNNKDGFLQCRNNEDSVLCEVPIWSKTLPNASNILKPVQDDEREHPEVIGSLKTEYLTKSQFEAARKVLAAFKLSSRLIYSKYINRDGVVVGTNCDLKFPIKLKYTNFEALVKAYLAEVFNISEVDGYVVLTGQLTDPSSGTR